MVVFRISLGGDFMDESKLSMWVVKSLTAELGLLNFCGVGTYLDDDSVLGVG